MAMREKAAMVKTRTPRMKMQKTKRRRTPKMTPKSDQKTTISKKRDDVIK